MPRLPPSVVKPRPTRLPARLKVEHFWHLWETLRPKNQGLYLPPSQPKQAVENEPVLGFIGKGKRKFFAALMLIIDVVVAHVEVDHPVAFICPHDGIITRMPDFVGFGSCTERETGGIN